MRFPLTLLWVRIADSGRRARKHRSQLTLFESFLETLEFLAWKCQEIRKKIT